MARVRWTEGAVLSIRVRDDLYCLAQMLRSPYLVFFDCFRADDEWADVVLDETPVLFHRGVTRQLLGAVEITVHREIAPATAAAIDPPTHWLQIGPGSQALTIWEGTADELTVMTLGEEGVRVVVKDIGAPGSSGAVPVGPYLQGPLHDAVDAYELDTLGVYPETVERLVLCHLFGRNVDPDKDLICGRDLPREFRTYYEAISR